MAILPQTSDDFLQLLDRSGLVPQEKIKQQLDGQTPPTMAMPFAKWLIQAGLLTAFQAEQILQGKSRGFYLGNYRVLERLGGGATAGVFLCEHKVMRHCVAVKVLSQALLQEDANNLIRFRREARAAAALSHPNIVRTIDLAEDNGRHFLVMEYAEGVTLDAWMKQNPTAPQRVFVNFIMQATLGLQHVHESALIHRDLKPNNLILDKQGTVKILDLGLAKFTDDRNDGLSKVQGAGIMGTVDFMSPEQADGNPDLDIRSDIYSLGATLYYMLTGGKVPFPGSTLGAKLLAIQFKKHKPIHTFRPDVDRQLEKIADRMMSKNIADRFQTPIELIQALKGWLKAPIKEVKRFSSAAIGTAESKALKTLQHAIPMAEPVEEKAAEPIRKIGRWWLSAAAFMLVVGGFAIAKPWNFGQKATAQTPSAMSPK